MTADALYRTHALLNVLWSSYQGMTTLLTLLGSADATGELNPTMAQCRRAVENLTAWRERWESGELWLAGEQASAADVQLAEAMLRGEGVVECVAAVEEALASVADDDI